MKRLNEDPRPLQVIAEELKQLPVADLERLVAERQAMYDRQYIIAQKAANTLNRYYNTEKLYFAVCAALGQDIPGPFTWA